MKHPILSLVVVTALLPGCVTYLIQDDVKAQREESKRTYYFNALKDQSFRMVKAGACARAAEHFESNSVGKASDFKNDDLPALDDRIKSSAKELVDVCLKEEAPKLQEKRRFERLAALFRALATLPIPEEEQKALVLRADTTDLLRADATVADAQKAWDAGKFYDALSGFMSAKYIAEGVKAATDEQKAKYTRLQAEKQRVYLDDLLKKAGEAGRRPETAHLAAIYLARAYEVGKDKAVGRRLEAIRQELLASHVYRWQVEWRGEPLITKAAKDVLQAHRFSGNLKAGEPREFVAVLDVGAFTVTPTEKEGSRTGEYKTGSKTVDNPEFRKLQTYVMKQQQCLMNISSFNFRNESSGFTDAQVEGMKRKTGCAQFCSSAECARKVNRKLLDEAEAKLAKQPMTLQEDLMSPWAYPTREWSQVIAAPVQLSLKHALEAASKSSTMTLSHEYTDHAHDLVAQLGLGKRQITKKSDAELAAVAGRELGDKMVAEIEEDYQAWFAATPKQGDRGAVLFVLLGGAARDYDAQLEKVTGVRNAHQILLAR